jgi:two-component system, sensor histidine kinase and response regulator
LGLALEASDDEEGGATGRVGIPTVTAHAMEGDRNQRLASGMDGDLSKSSRASGLQPPAACEAGRPQQSAPRETSGQRPVLDFAGATAALGGRTDLLRELLGIFLQDVPERLRAARDACRNGDIETLRQMAHSIKGSAGTVRAWRLYDTARELESAARADQKERCALLLRDLEAEVKNVLAAVGEHQWPSP